MNKNDFIEFFNDDELINQLTVDDRIELFFTIMKDSNDITKELLNEIISDYSAEIEVVSKAVEEPHTREDFMLYLRDSSKLEQLTQEERIEIFKYALIGSSDFTKKLFDDLLEKYKINNLEVIDHSQETFKLHEVVVTYGEEQVKKMHDSIPLTKREKEQFVKTYKFETIEEAKAFKEGLEEGNGWREFYII